jgi:hypothetical protein
MADETKVAESKKFDLTKLNTLAVVSLATAVTGFGAVAGVITGHIALSQIKKSGEAGRPAAIAGVVLGYAFVGLGIAMAVAGAFMRTRGYELDHRGGFRPDGMMGGQFGGPMHMDGDHFGKGGMMDFDPNQTVPAPTDVAPEPTATPESTN